MSFKYKSSSRLLAMCALATVALTTVAEAQMYAPDQGGGGMMGRGWGMGYGMGGYGYGGIGILVLALVVLGIAFMAFRRRTP